MEKEKKLARERAAVILMVHSSKLTAAEGAQRLGVSRKTYYEWEDRALQAMAQALENHSPGRPPDPGGQGVFIILVSINLTARLSITPVYDAFADFIVL